MPGALQRAWLRRGPLACLLFPLSLLYRGLAALHRGLYRSGLRHCERMPVPVVVVGNVIAGGAGKTPVVIALVEHLRRRGLAVGVVSRGYGRLGRDCREVQPDDDPRLTGDEPLLVRRKSGAPVFVAPRRADAARALLAAYPATQLIVSDDGLQHHALARDLEICVFDARAVGNGWLLPAGPLREPWPRAVDMVLRPPEAGWIAGHAVRRAFAPAAVRADGATLPLGHLRGKPLQAVAGIANPDTFFGMLRDAGLAPTVCTALSDHAAMDDGAGWLQPGHTIVCTEKDAVKLWRLRPDAWAVPLTVEIAPAFWDSLDRRLEPKLSSAHGSPTA